MAMFNSYVNLPEGKQVTDLSKHPLPMSAPKMPGHQLFGTTFAWTVSLADSWVWFKTHGELPQKHQKMSRFLTGEAGTQRIFEWTT